MRVARARSWDPFGARSALEGAQIRATADTPARRRRPWRLVASASRTSRLAVALDAARAELASRDYEGALRATDDYRVRFPAGELGREVEVVVIEVLSAKGSGGEARARAFLATYPNDPHGSRVRSLAE